MVYDVSLSLKLRKLGLSENQASPIKVLGFLGGVGGGGGTFFLLLCPSAKEALIFRLVSLGKETLFRCLAIRLISKVGNFMWMIKRYPFLVGFSLTG